MLVGIILTACLLFTATNGADSGVEFSYDEQTVWTGVCNSGNTGRQSPINIVTANARENSQLSDLQLGTGWTTSTTGTFRNGGHNVQFDPISITNPDVTTTNYLGEYRVLQMHMHWGADDQEGSEHTVNNGRYPLELHFVHSKVGETDTTIGDYYSVIGVFAEVDEAMPISGVWAELNISAIQAYQSATPVTGFTYRSLLPSSLDYYHYPGSLTTPPCSETVQWFVLKDTITVPGAYLNLLRQIGSDANQTALMLNFRDPQPLSQRTVYTFESGSPKIVASALSMLIVMFITIYL